MARFVTLCSGSSGNAALVEEEGRFLLIDTGISCRRLVQKIEELGLLLTNLCGILITHEHIDHVKGLEVFTRKTGVPVLATAETLDMLREKKHLSATIKQIRATDGERIELDGFFIESFSTCHDAAGCCGFFIQTAKGCCMTIATDLGVLSDDVFLQFQKSHLVAIESNYDENLLKISPYPPVLKQRIRSKYGHLSNADCAAAVVALVTFGCRKVVLCHLSADNNHPDIVKTGLDEVFLKSGHPCPPDCDIQVAPRFETGRWMIF